MEHFAGIPDLSKEASDIFIWCLTQNPECYRQWVSIWLIVLLLLHMFIKGIVQTIFFINLLLHCEYLEQDMLYLENLDASVVVLKKLSDEWKEHASKHTSLDPLRETLKSFREKVIIYRY